MYGQEDDKYAALEAKQLTPQEGWLGEDIACGLSLTHELLKVQIRLLHRANLSLADRLAIENMTAGKDLINNADVPVNSDSQSCMQPQH